MLCMRKQKPFPGRLPYRNNCHRCLRPGHRSRECRAAAPACSQSHSNTGQIFTLSAAVHGLTVVDTTVAGKQYPFLVDTAAEISFIPITVAKESLLKVDQRLPRRPIMVDGSSICCEGTASTNLDVGPSRTPSTLYVVPNI